MMSDYVPTIDDLRVKLCFICREEETYDKPEDPPRNWTHPCQCTLIAHEECLLEWIKTAQTKSTTTAVENALKCPQCGARYQLESDLPFGMRLMNEALIKWNVSLGTIGKWLLTAVPVGLVAGVVVGTHFALTQYGAYAVKEFFGNELFEALLTSDPSKWPWTALINLPLIPLGLISYRFNSTYNIFPAISSLLDWPDFQIRHGQNSNNDLLPWPPSPFTVGFIALPLTRYLYRKCLERVTRWVLQTSPQRGLNAAIEGDDDDRLLVIRFRHAQGNDGEPGGGDLRGAEDDNENPGNGGEASIRIYASPLGRRIGGALLIPFISKRMGNLLLRLSKYSELLRRFLAIRRPGRWPFSSLTMRSPASIGFSAGKNIFGQEREGEVTWRLVLRALWGGGRAWAEFDPVWWRNTIGFGIFVVAKDVIHLLHLYLVKKEFESRRVKNRDFRGVDVSGLDLLHRRESR
ncbi:hypothetical protein E1B28_012727 [Marasmius oreades]|uniref:RING-CH-type domain-containing protein n=1 Tax=Marasmius oreades TaxID=181124 RepID=A0A9P7RT63_9AGAR|nr:uncharacterized protein E1B28_012727 [Marasmius oreades]KAG7088761.1 hypothetical protein E1B28_012727 [Marasmius oreades]